MNHLARAWLFLTALAIAARAAPAPLPVIEVPATLSPADAPLLVFMSGDGGWATFVREISHRLAGDGWPVVGFNLRKYLSVRRTPEETAAAIDAIIGEYGAKWQRRRVVLAGFSRGADIAAFVLNRLPAPTRERVVLVVMLSPGATAEFEFHVADFLRKSDPAGQRPVADEIVRMGAQPLLILHGAKDEEALVLPAAPGRIIRLPGDHHLDFDYATIVKLIEAAERGATKALPKPTR